MIRPILTEVGLFLIPFAVYALFLVAFAAYPIVFALVLVFLHWDLVTPPSFAGLAVTKWSTRVATKEPLHP